MRAVRYYGKEDVRIEDIEPQELKPGTVRINPAYVGVCGSDLHLYFDGPISPAPVDGPHPCPVRNSP